MKSAVMLVFFLLIFPVACGDMNFEKNVKTWKFDVPEGYFIEGFSADVEPVPYEKVITVPLRDFELTNLTMDNGTIMHSMVNESIMIDSYNISGMNTRVDEGVIHPKISVMHERLFSMDCTYRDMKFLSFSGDLIVWEEDLKTHIMNVKTKHEWISGGYMMCPSADDYNGRAYLSWIDMDGNFSVHVGIFDGEKISKDVEVGRASDFWGMIARRTFIYAHDEILVVWSKWSASGWVVEYAVLDKELNIYERGSKGPGEAVGFSCDEEVIVYKMLNGSLYESGMDYEKLIDTDVKYASSSCNKSVAWITDDGSLKVMTDGCVIEGGHVNASACRLISLVNTEIVLLDTGYVYVRNGEKLMNHSKFKCWDAGFSKGDIFLSKSNYALGMHRFSVECEDGIIEHKIPLGYEPISYSIEIRGNCSPTLKTENGSLTFTAVLRMHNWLENLCINISHYSLHGTGKARVLLPNNTVNATLMYECDIPYKCSLTPSLSNKTLLIEMRSCGSCSSRLMSIKIRAVCVDNPEVEFDIFSDGSCETFTGTSANLTQWLYGVDSDCISITTISTSENYNVSFEIAFKRHVFLKNNISSIRIREDSRKKIYLRDYFQYNGKLRYAFFCEHASCTVENDVLTITPEKDWYGDVYGYIKAYDTSNYSATAKFMLHVENINDEPILKIYGPEKISVGKRYAWKIETHDVDGDFVRISVVDFPQNMELSDRNIYWTPDKPGRYAILISADDGKCRIIKKYEICVEDGVADREKDDYQHMTSVSSIKLLPLIILIGIIIAICTCGFALGKKKTSRIPKSRCSACLSFFKNGEKIVVCKKCGSSYHKRCFQSIGKCPLCSFRAYHERPF